MIFSGSSNKPLAKKLADMLNCPLGEVELGRFENDEERVWVKEKRIPREVVILQSLSRPTDEHLVEFCLLADALKRLGADRIIAVVPWLGYSKQDKVFRQGEPLSVKVIAKMLQVVPFARLITFELHNLSILGFFDIPVVNLSAKSVFLEYFLKVKDSNFIVVAPDAGAVKASRAFAEDLNVPVAYIDKKRDFITGKVKVIDITRSVEGAHVLIIDDMVATGSTLINTANFLQKNGAQSISVAVTHHLFVPGVQEKLDESPITNIVTTDTIEAQGTSDKLSILSISDLLASELKNS